VRLAVVVGSLITTHKRRRPTALRAVVERVIQTRGAAISGEPARRAITEELQLYGIIKQVLGAVALALWAQMQQQMGW
jgi:hypothetical protein